MKIVLLWLQRTFDTKYCFLLSLEIRYNEVFTVNCCRSQYFSPLDDLAFDMYQDPDVAEVIRKLERKKRDAVSSKHNILDIFFRNMRKNSDSAFS